MYTTKQPAVIPIAIGVSHIKGKNTSPEMLLYKFLQVLCLCKIDIKNRINKEHYTGIHNYIFIVHIL